MTREEAEYRARNAIEYDAIIVYDACANLGLMVGNTPPKQLLRIVTDFIMEE
jgi:hypothetical protein